MNKKREFCMLVPLWDDADEKKRKKQRSWKTEKK
jgi:hypothetical protein